MRQAFLLRPPDYAFIPYRENTSGGIELFDVQYDPGQFTNLAADPEFGSVVRAFNSPFASKLSLTRTNGLELNDG